MKNWFKRKTKKETSTDIQALKEQLKEELKAEVRQELKDELREEVKAELLKEQSSTISSAPHSSKAKPTPSVSTPSKTKEKKTASLSLVKKESRSSTPMNRTCRHCERTLLTINGEIDRGQCKVSDKDSKGICYLACRCGYVSRFHQATLKLEGTGANPTEMNHAARLFKSAGLVPSSTSLTGR